MNDSLIDTQILSALSLAGLAGCGANPDMQAANYNLQSHLEALSIVDFGSEGGTVGVAPSGAFLVANVAGDHTAISSSVDGVKFTVIATLPEQPYSMVTHAGSVYLSTLTTDNKAGSRYQSKIFRSDDNGVTWVQTTAVNGGVKFSPVFEGTKIAAAVMVVPQSTYRAMDVDFAWYDESTLSFETVSRLATHGEIAGTFPSEVALYRRPSDAAIVAAVRWGEYPEIPFQRLVVSKDAGESWHALGRIWGGLAGFVSICRTDDGQFWATGYDERTLNDVFSAVWKFDPETGRILEIHYPFLAGKVGFKGNGGIASIGNNIAVVTGNGTLNFLLLKGETQ